MFREGEALSNAGRDPRRGGDSKSRWENRSNHAWLVRAIATPEIVEKSAFYRSRCAGLNKSNRPEQLQSGPSYLAPGHTLRATKGIVGKLRWFYPSLADTLVFFLLFQLSTGWNESTALNLDISDERWATSHHLQPRLKILRAYKPRSGAYQQAISLEHAEWRPYQLVCFMLASTAGLRRKLQSDISKLKHELTLHPTPALRHELADLIQRSKSPWLFHSLDHVGEVIALTSSFNGMVNRTLKALIERHDIRTSSGTLCNFTGSDWRDAFAANSNELAGLFAARSALGHASNSVIHRYLSQPRLHKHANDQIVALTRNALSEIRSGRLLDGSTLKVLVQNGSITELQRARIVMFRNRTRSGMGCLDPYAPPPSIAPDHKAGNLCRIQRCTMCPNSVLFDDSFDRLTRRYAELVTIQGMIPMTTWLESDYEAEKDSLEVTLLPFGRNQVESAVAAHAARFQSGEETVLDLEGSYEDG